MDLEIWTDNNPAIKEYIGEFFGFFVGYRGTPFYIGGCIMQEVAKGYLIEDDNVRILFTNRTVDAKNTTDVKNLCEDYSFNYDNLMYNTQVHGANVRVIKTIDSKKNNEEKADGLVTSLKNVPLLIFTADCVPLVFYDKEKAVVALAHAGWRGTYDNIAEEIIEVLVNDYNCRKENIKVIIGPSVSGDSYEVSYELVEKFAVHKIDNYYKKCGDKYYLDLWIINKGLLKRAGILDKNITLTNFCTVKDNNQFFSYRLDNATTKRIGTFIELK